MLLDTLIVAGLVAAVLPTPTNFQYALPALPALFIRLGHAPPAEPRRWMSRIAVALIALGLVLSLGYHASYVLGDRRHKHDWPTLALTRQAHWIGERLRAAGASGAVASLRPEVVVDSGYRLDSRFATGPFVFRTAQTMPAAELTRLKAVGPQTLGAALDADPPAGIVVGGVPRFDPELIEAALARGYRPEASPNGHFTLFVRPAAPAPQAPVKAGG